MRRARTLPRHLRDTSETPPRHLLPLPLPPASGGALTCPCARRYDVGARLNLQQIFGKPLGARCLLPLPPRSLDTDGLTFPLNKRCVALPSPSLTSPALPPNALPPRCHRLATASPPLRLGMSSRMSCRSPRPLEGPTFDGWRRCGVGRCGAGRCGAGRCARCAAASKRELCPDGAAPRPPLSHPCCRSCRCAACERAAAAEALLRCIILGTCARADNAWRRLLR